MDDNEERLLRSVALQNARAVLLARERAERELFSAKEELERKSAELGEQREFFRVTLSSIGDAVITTDTQGVITFLNPVAEALTGWNFAEAVGQPLETVFTIINEQTRETAPNPAARVLREGRIVGLANHTALIARDGKETAIDDSASPIQDVKGTVSGVVLVFRDVTERRRAETALHESNQSLTEARNHLEKRVLERTAELSIANDNLRELSGRLQQSRDEERRQLARELHDSVGQMLVAISMNIAIVQSKAAQFDPAVARASAENAGLVAQISQEIRTMSYLLHPPLLDVAGLPSAVQCFVDGFAERSKVRVDLDIPAEFRRFPDDVELTIFRVVQECLTNIHRHSGSDTATIAIREDQETLIVQIKDTGKGIPPSKLSELNSGRTGVGFRGMRERLRQFNGNLNIHSDVGGTLITAQIPLSLILPPAGQAGERVDGPVHG